MSRAIRQAEESVADARSALISALVTDKVAHHEAETIVDALDRYLDTKDSLAWAQKNNRGPND